MHHNFVLVVEVFVAEFAVGVVQFLAVLEQLPAVQVLVVGEL
jgi:hypothetical protein